MNETTDANTYGVQTVQCQNRALMWLIGSLIVIVLAVLNADTGGAFLLIPGALLAVLGFYNLAVLAIARGIRIANLP